MNDQAGLASAGKGEANGEQSLFSEVGRSSDFGGYPRVHVFHLVESGYIDGEVGPSDGIEGDVIER